MIIIFAVPTICNLAGMKIEAIRVISKGMLYNLACASFENGQLMYTWNTNEGFLLCILAGVVGTVLFIVIGMCCFNKRELK